MRIRKRPVATTTLAVVEVKKSSNVCSWCGESIAREEERDGSNLGEGPQRSSSPRQSIGKEKPEAHCSSLPALPSLSCATEPESKSKSSASTGTTPVSQLLRMVFSQTPNASLTPRQALARMILSGLSGGGGGEEPALLLEQVVTAMSTDPYFVPLKRGRFRVRNTADEMDDGTTLPVPQPKAVPKTLRLLDGLPDFELDDQEPLCSCKNGNGWKCSQKAKPGYLLCEHHLDLNFRRKMRRVSRMKDELTARMKQSLTS